MRQKVTFRTHGQVSRFFDGLELLEPGVVALPEWRPDVPADPGAPVTATWGASAARPETERTRLPDRQDAVG